MGMLRVWNGKVVTGKSQVKQSFKNECDINVIMAKYRKSGILPSLILENPQYGDFSDVPSYLDACNLVIKANTQFEALDLSLKNKFRNNPEEFLAFVNDPNNKEELYKLGLAIKPAADVLPTNDDNLNNVNNGGTNA